MREGKEEEKKGQNGEKFRNEGMGKRREKGESSVKEKTENRRYEEERRRRETKKS